MRSLSRADAEQRLREWGYEPVGEYPGVGTLPWKVRCVTCGGTRLIAVSKNPRRCHHVARLTGPEAEEVLATFGYQPEEPYPGATKKWAVRCTTCGRLRTVRLNSLKTHPDRRCKHSTARTLTPEEAEAELATYGFEPVEKFSGRVRDMWPVRCTTCRQRRSVRLTDLRADPDLRRCAHTLPRKKRNEK